MDERKPWEQAAAVLPEALRDGLSRLGEDRLDQLEELRLRRGFPLAALFETGEADTDTPPVGEDDLRRTVENATQSSAHTALDKACRGFYTLRGGHRMGMCGTVVNREGRAAALRELSSLSIRVARPVTGLAGPLLRPLTEEGRFLSTLIVAPPGAGKTTLLRDLVRALSDGEAGEPLRVSVADERGEIAALWEGKPELDVGKHTDVMDGCPKALGLELLLRGMNPQVLAADELTSPDDLGAAELAAGCGVPLLATAHGGGRQDLLRRPLYRELLALGIFQKLVTIRRGPDGERETAVEDIEVVFPEEERT